MKNIFALLLAVVPFFLSAQDCLNFPDTTFVCGFNTVLPTTDLTGTWAYLCDESAGTVAIKINADDNTEVKVSECGEYYFSFTASAPDCIETDTIMVYFDDPSYNSSYGSAYGSLEYGDYGCHSGGSGCGFGGGPTTIGIGGATPPNVAWELDVDGGCSSINYSTEIINPSSDNCEAEDIIIFSVSSGDTDSIHLIASQEYVLEQYGQIFDSLEAAFLDSLADNGCQLINPGCSSICMDNPEIEGDTIVFDTIITIIPYRVGGNWSLVIGDTCLILEDSTIFSFNGSTDLRLIVEPGSDYYGPGSIYWTLEEVYYNTSGDTIYGGIQNDYTLTAQWKEFFEYDTITQIIPHTIPDLICNGCGGNSYSFTEGLSSVAPTYDCGPITLTFFYDECFCNPPYLEAIVQDEISCADPCTIVEFVTDSWGAFYTVYTPSGELINTSGNDIWACEIGIHNVEMISDNGCITYTSFTVTGDFEEFESIFNAEVCIGECYEWNDETYCESGSYEQILTAERNGCDSVVVLNLLINDLEEQHELHLVCIGETYNGYPPGGYIDIYEEQCMIRYLTVVELVPTPPIFETVTICEGECYSSLSGEEYCDTGVYSSLISDLDGCEMEIITELTVEPTSNVSLTLSNNINCLETTATVSATGGFDSYLWEDGSTSSDLIVSSAGSYNVTVVSANGCESEASIIVVDNSEATYEYETVSLCDGQCFEVNGQDICETSTLSSTSQNPDNGCDIITEYQITVEGAADVFQTEFVCPGEDYLGYQEGEHTIEEIDDNGCVSILYLTVIENSVQNIEETLSICSGECTDWNGVTYCNSGTYTSTSEENGCIVTQELTLTVEEEIIYEITVSNNIDCDNDSATLSVPNQNGTYQWSTGEIGTSIIVNAAGEYSVQFISENDCSVSTLATVEEITENTILEEILYICPGECIMVNGQEVCEEGMYTNVVGSGPCTTTFISEVRQMSASITPTIIPSLDCDNNQGTLYLAFGNEWSAFLEFVIIYPNGNTVQTTDMPFVTNITQAGTIQFIGYYYSANGSTCETVLELEIMDNSEQIEISMSGNPEINCETGYTQPETSVLDGYNYDWSGPGITSDNANEVNPLLTETGNYTLTVSNPNSGCSTQSSFTVLPQTEIEVSTAIEQQISCQTGFALPQTTVYSDYNYVWTGNGISAENINAINPELNLAGIYNVLVTNPDNACTGTAEFTVLPQTEIIASASSEATCEDNAEGQVVITNISGGALPYLYSIDGENWQTEADFTNLENGDYVVQVQDAESCETEVLTSIEVLLALPEITADITEFSICGTEEIIIDATVPESENLNYLWSNGQTDAILTTSISGNYDVEISNSCATEILNYTVEATETALSKFIYIPDAFSPNADEHNPVFKGYFGKEVVDYQFRVYDRWGNLVFTSKDPEAGWDGSKQGQTLTNGVYIWQMMVKMESCEETAQTFDLSGDVLLLR